MSTTLVLTEAQRQAIGTELAQASGDPLAIPKAFRFARDMAAAVEVWNASPTFRELCASGQPPAGTP